MGETQTKNEQRLPDRIELEEYTGEVHKPYLFNYADGVDGHYCISRKSIDGHYEFWQRPDNWIFAPNGERDIVGHIFDDPEAAVIQLYHLRRAAMQGREDHKRAD
jgi:hypothetical protein